MNYAKPATGAALLLAVMAGVTGSPSAVSLAGRTPQASPSAEQLVQGALQHIRAARGLRFASGRKVGYRLKPHGRLAVATWPFSGVARVAGGLQERLVYGKTTPASSGPIVFTHSLIAHGMMANFDKNGASCGPFSNYTVVASWMRKPFVQPTNAFAFLHLARMMLAGSRRVGGQMAWRIVASGPFIGRGRGEFEHEQMKAEILVMKSDDNLVAIHGRTSVRSDRKLIGYENDWLRISSYHAHVSVMLPRFCYFK